VRRPAVIAASVTIFALGGCGGKAETPPLGGKEQAPSVPESITNEEALRLIRSCGVTEYLTLHSGETRLTLEDGSWVSVIRPDDDALLRAGVEAQQSGCEIALGEE